MTILQEYFIVQVRLSDCYVRRVFSTQSKKAANTEWAAIKQAAKGERGFHHYGASAEFRAEMEKGASC